jgi:hypothetical protein
VEAVPAPAEPSVDAPVPAAEPNVTLLPPPTNATLVPSPLVAVVPPPSGAPVVLEGKCVYVLCLGCLPAHCLLWPRLSTLPAPSSCGTLRSLVSTHWPPFPQTPHSRPPWTRRLRAPPQRLHHQWRRLPQPAVVRTHLPLASLGCGVGVGTDYAVPASLAPRSWLKVNITLE